MSKKSLKDLGQRGRQDYEEELKDLHPDELHLLGEALVEYMSRPDSLWYKGWLSQYGLTAARLAHAIKQCPWFQNYIDRAMDIQEDRLINLPFFKQADAGHAKFILQQRFRSRGYGEDLEEKRAREQLEATREMRKITAMVYHENKLKELQGEEE